jgi:hypothetical protein
MRTLINFVIGLLVMAGMFLVDAPKWAAIGTAVITFYIYCAADYVIDAIKSERAK